MSLGRHRCPICDRGMIPVQGTFVKGVVMAAIVLERTVAASPGRVFASLTQADELARWWTTDLSARPEVGSLAEFHFNQGAAIRQFAVAELDAGERVVWIVRHGPAHWVG